MFDWFGFLEQHGIYYTTVGPNASPGRVNIKCPFCADDPSEHMGISLNGKGWSCWRAASHSGRDQARLVAYLVGCGLEEARRIMGGAAALPIDTDWLAEARAKLGVVSEETSPPKSIELLEEFKPLDNGSPLGRPFRSYLEERGYRGNSLSRLIQMYDLHYATRGKFAYRVIIPVYDRWRELWTWTGRAINSDAELRYKTPKKLEQVRAAKQALLGLPMLWRCPNPKTLVVCEGPFDAMWVTTYGASMGVYATCLFGLSLAPEQINLLEELRSRFARIVILLDDGAHFQAFKMASLGLGFDVQRLSPGVKDPATLQPGAVIDLCASLSV